LTSCAKENQKRSVLIENTPAKDNISVLDFMFNVNYSKIIRPDGEETYIGTIFIKNDAINIIYESDAGFYPSIMAWRNGFNTFEIIIKSRWCGSDWADDINGKTPVYYYLVEFTKENLNVNYTCKKINCNEMDIENKFYMNTGIINDDNVNLRIAPALNGEIYKRINTGELVEVNYFGNYKYIEIDNIPDSICNCNPPLLSKNFRRGAKSQTLHWCIVDSTNNTI
jgi:hypothetical protein